MKPCFLLSLLTACSWGYQSPPHIDYADTLSAHFSHDYQARNQLLQESSGGGMSDAIECISCGYVGCRNISIEEGRRLFVDGIESLCAIFNNDLTIRPYLHNYPFLEHNIRLTLSFYNTTEGQIVKNPYVNLIFCAHHTIFYDTYDAATEQYCALYKEPYEEAVRIVHEERKLKNLRM